MLCLPHILALALHSQGGFNTAVPGLGALCRHGADDAWLLVHEKRHAEQMREAGTLAWWWKYLTCKARRAWKC